MARISIRRQHRSLGRLVVTGVGLSLAVMMITIVLTPESDRNGPLPWILFSTLLLVSLITTGGVARRNLDRLRNDIIGLNDIATAIPAGQISDLSATATINVDELERLALSIDRTRESTDRDIAAMKRLEQVRSEFLGNVSHELRTPIFTVQGFLETLLDGAVDDPDVRDEFLQKAHDNLIRLHALLNDLIEISRIESGEMKLSFRYFDLLDLCRGTLHNLSDRAALNTVMLKMQVTEEDSEGKVQVYADRKRVEQALVNLLDNAIKYNRPDGVVTLTVTVEGEGVMVDVSDNGPGIAPEHHDRIFERFYRVDRGRSREVGGSGLGLSIVKHIVEAHGSSINVASDLGAGTTFSFRLPRFD